MPQDFGRARNLVSIFAQLWTRAHAPPRPVGSHPSKCNTVAEYPRPVFSFAKETRCFLGCDRPRAQSASRFHNSPLTHHAATLRCRRTGKAQHEAAPPIHRIAKGGRHALDISRHHAALHDPARPLPHRPRKSQGGQTARARSPVWATLLHPRRAQTPSPPGLPWGKALKLCARTPSK